MNAAISSKQINLNSFRSGNMYTNRVTATEVIDGVKCQITLEQDTSGRYREIKLTPLEQTHTAPNNLVDKR